MFRDARSLRQLAEEGGAAWLWRNDFAVWTVGRDRVGWALWGHIGSDTAEDMKQIWITVVRQLCRPYDLVQDLRSMESVSPGAFELVREFAVAPKPGLRRHAILVTDAQPSTVQLGLYALSPPDHQWRAFRASDEAARWLGWPDAQGVLDAVEARLGERSSTAPIVAALRRQLAGELKAGRVPVLEETARALALSVRGLQRALAAARSSFSAQLDAARIERARALLGEPANKLDAVARAVGFADTKSLIRLFRRIQGEGPSEFRRRLREPE